MAERDVRRESVVFQGVTGGFDGFRDDFLDPMERIGILLTYP